VRVRAARDIGGGTVETDEDVAVGIRVADDTDELAGNIAGIESGKISTFARAGTAVMQLRSAFPARARRPLQFTVEVGFQKQLLSLAFAIGGGLHLVNGRMRRAALG